MKIKKKSGLVNGIRKGLILADAQIPYQIDMRPVERYMVDLQPDVLFYLGDWLDMTSLLRWNSIRPGDIDWDEIRAEVDVANDMLDRHQMLLKTRWNSIEKHFFFGNHELRLYSFREANPEYLRKNRDVVPELIRDLKLKERGFQVHFQNDLVNVGKVYFTHGSDWSTFCTRKMLADYEVNLCFGHIHSPQRWTKVARVNRAPKSAWAVGCLCNRNPDWKGGLPNSWVHGFATAYFWPDGNFNLFPTDIIKGKFVAPSGKFYD